MREVFYEKVTHVRHWSNKLFSFRTTRRATFNFENGQFVLIGLEIEGKPLLRAYSIASANYEDELEFFSVKVANGALTSRLQHLEVGDDILVSARPTGTLVPGHLIPGRHLYLLATGTGLAPFLSIIKDPAIYEQYEKVILVHGVSFISDLAYQDTICNELPQNEYFGEWVRDKLIYYPTVTRQPYHSPAQQQRITCLIESNTLTQHVNMPILNPDVDRLMLCGNHHMLEECISLLEQRGFQKATSRRQGHYVLEQAFLEK